MWATPCARAPSIIFPCSFVMCCPLADAQGAAARRKDLQTERDDTYGRVFEAIINE